MECNILYAGTLDQTKKGFNNWIATDPTVGKVKLGYLKLSDADWITIEEIVEHLSVFEEASKLLSGDKYVTLSMVMPTFIELFSYIKSVIKKPGVSLQIKQTLTNAHSILSKYYAFSGDSMFYLAVILDPRFKAQYLIDKEFNKLYDRVVDKTIYQISQLVKTKYTVEDNVNESSKGSGSKLLTGMFMHSVIANNKPEIGQYLNLPVENHSIDPLQWWKSHVPQFPKLSIVAKEILSIPGSAVSVERVFNVGRCNDYIIVYRLSTIV